MRLLASSSVSMKECNKLNAHLLTPSSPSSLYQARRGESTAVQPEQFPRYEVSLARPSMPLLRISFVNDLSFPTLLLVDERHPRSPICNLHLTIIASISPKTVPMESAATTPTVFPQLFAQVSW